MPVIIAILLLAVASLTIYLIRKYSASKRHAVTLGDYYMTYAEGAQLSDAFMGKRY